MKKPEQLNFLTPKLGPKDAWHLLIECLKRQPMTHTLDAALGVLNHHYEGFVVAPASTNHHHNFAGGLVLHTLEVTLMCEAMQPNNDALVIAAALHDVMKVAEYLYSTSAYREQVGHVVGGVIELTKSATLLSEKWCGMNCPVLWPTTHAMLAHHGKREWGSPVAPCTDTARILHDCDMESAQRPYFIGGI